MVVPKSSSLTNCGLFAPRRLGLQPSVVSRLVRVRHLQLVPVRGKERRSLAGETSVEEIVEADQIMVTDWTVDLVLLEMMGGRTTRRFGAMDAESLVTSRIIVLTLRANKELP